jgi:putative Ca2+/H+ antiporter (TMEM165/GDT1 family)
VISAFFVAFATVFVAELPDKTMVASIVLTTRTHRPLAVWVGVAGAFVLHVVLAVTIGSALRRLPRSPVELVVAAIFLVGGVVLLRGGAGDQHDATTVAVRSSFKRVALVSAAAVGLAEFGDLTQLATAALATRYGAPVAVGLGAWCALAAVAALAVTSGSFIVKRVPLRWVRRAAGALFLALGTATVIAALG